MTDNEIGSRAVARAAITLSMTNSREEENAWKKQIAQQGIRSVAVDYGGELMPSVMRIVERAVVAAKRESVITDTHHEEGAVAGAAHEALSQVFSKAAGLSVGGKIAVARSGEHVAVALFFSIGLMHFNEVCIGMGHRSL
ncbi:MAG: HutP family protein [Clostridia bacterium]|nr:HutP family protein [Clostridia bacterium]